MSERMPGSMPRVELRPSSASSLGRPGKGIKPKGVISARRRKPLPRVLKRKDGTKKKACFKDEKEV